MIRDALRMLRGEVRGMHAAAYVLGLSALSSALLALIRDRLFAHTFGASEMLDIYYAAFRIPDLIFVLVASLFSAYVLIPELSKRMDRADARRYLDAICIGYGALMVAVSAIAFVLTPSLLSMLFPELYAGAHREEFLLLARLLLLQPLFLGASNIFAAITQHEHRYGLYAVTPLLYNAAIILGLLFLYPYFSLFGIGLGVVIGALLHVGVQVPAALRAQFLSTSWPRADFAVVWETMRVSLPRTLALSMGQLLIFGLLALAGVLQEGSIAIFIFALNLQAVPLSIIGASYSVAAFPTLSRMFAQGDTAAFVEQVVSASRHIIFWSAPAVALFIILRAHVVRVVLGSGAFDWTDTRLTAAALALLITALIPQSLSLLLVRGYYAAGRSYVPLLVTLFSSVVAYVCALGFLGAFSFIGVVHFVGELLRVSDVPGVEVLALPAAYSIGMWISFILLTLLFEQRFRGFVRGISRTVWESLTAAGLAGATAYALLALLGEISPLDSLVAVLVQAFIAGVGGILVGIAVYALAGSQELQETYQTIARRTKPAAHPGSSEEQLTQ
ncbi:MAG: hypothetical protein KBE09_02565 [Candidatus Pacebacteria bacterium]|nr:hypothetical protein [Candidatus Paceibacterota bacterium]